MYGAEGEPSESPVVACQARPLHRLPPQTFPVPANEHIVVSPRVTENDISDLESNGASTEARLTRQVMFDGSSSLFLHDTRCARKPVALRWFGIKRGSNGRKETRVGGLKPKPEGDYPLDLGTLRALETRVGEILSSRSPW